MKKKIFLIIQIFIFMNLSACTGYKPIFSSSNINFKIANYSIAGDKKLGNQIYSKLYNVSRSNKDSSQAKKISLLINVSKEKNVTAKNSAGKVLGYRVILNSSFLAKDLSEGDEILNEKFSFSSTYKTLDQFSENIKLENKIIEDLLDKTYQDLLIKISESIL